jgi:hypothetical protein
MSKWANLNDEGMKHWGEIFKDGVVPIEGSIAPSKAEVAGTHEPLEVYVVAWDELSAVQRSLVIKKLSKKSRATEAEIENEILLTGLPLQSKYVSSVGLDGNLIA